MYRSLQLLASMCSKQRASAGQRASEFRKFSLSLTTSFSFNALILTVIALDSVLIGIQASGYVAMKSGELAKPVFAIIPKLTPLKIP